MGDMDLLKALRLLGDSGRLRILRLLQSEELSVAELQEILGMGQSRISMQLSQLKTAGFVAARRAGQDIGTAHVLRRYARRRRSADTLDALGFDALARAYAWQSPPLVAARAIGVRLLDRLAPLKRRLSDHAAGL